MTNLYHLEPFVEALWREDLRDWPWEPAIASRERLGGAFVAGQGQRLIANILWQTMRYRGAGKATPGTGTGHAGAPPQKCRSKAPAKQRRAPGSHAGVLRRKCRSTAPENAAALVLNQVRTAASLLAVDSPGRVFLLVDGKTGIHHLLGGGAAVVDQLGVLRIGGPRNEPLHAAFPGARLVGAEAAMLATNLGDLGEGDEQFQVIAALLAGEFVKLRSSRLAADLFCVGPKDPGPR